MLKQAHERRFQANLCAGYVAIKKYERALENCDQSLAIVARNWRAWQNRAAATDLGA